MAEPLASVVIPARQAEQVLPHQLTCLAEQTTSSFEVLIADNGGSEQLRGIAEVWRQHLDLRVVDATGRIGCGPARNVGVANARSDRLLFCDADDYVAPGWVEAFLGVLEVYDFATGPKAMVTERRVAETSWRQLLHVAEFSNGPNTAGTRPYASGNNAAYRRDVLQAIGGFGSHNLRREDVEASWLALDRGYRLGFAAGARILYVQRDSLRRRWWQSFGYGVGFEALRRQFDDGGQAPQTVSAFVKVGLSRIRRSPEHVVPFGGSLCGQLVERALPGRYFERVRARSGFGSVACSECLGTCSSGQRAGL